jgi:acetolactate synthase I/II/III large subunit
LVKEKVPYILGYAGHGAIGLLDGLYKQTDRIRHISPRIEQAAGFMADVYYRLTGQPLAVYASTGPGPMNLLISVTNAYDDASVFFVITGQVPTNQFGTGALQDDYRYHGDMSSMFAPVVKRSWRIRKVEDLVKALPDAFSLMRMGRPGPVHFHMPYDLYMRTAAVSTPEPSVHGSPLNWRTTVGDETVEKALALLTSAQRPLILASGGVRVGRAYDELKSLAEQLDIPVYTSFMGKGALPADHRLHLGVAGVWGEYPATEAVRNADVILAIGARILARGFPATSITSRRRASSRSTSTRRKSAAIIRSRSAWSATPRLSSLRQCGSRAPKVCAAAMADHGTRRSKLGEQTGAISANRSSAPTTCRSSRAA